MMPPPITATEGAGIGPPQRVEERLGGVGRPRGPVDRADHRDARGAGRERLGDALRSEPAHGQNRPIHRSGDGLERGQALGRPVAPLGRRVVDRPEDDEVGALRGRVPRLGLRVHGGAHEKPGRRDRAEGRYRQRGVGALDPVGTGRQGDVGAVVDDEPRAVVAGGLAEGVGQRQQLPRLQVLLAELHGAEARGQALLHHVGRRPGRRRAVGDQVEGEA
jgi:hypothetical protein